MTKEVANDLVARLSLGNRFLQTLDIFFIIILCSDFYSGDFHFGFDGSGSDDAFEDEKKKKTPNPKQKRTKECPGCGAIVAVSLRECRLCDYQFTSKSMIMGNTTAQQEAQSIRDKFPFEPERVRLV